MKNSRVSPPEALAAVDLGAFSDQILPLVAAAYNSPDRRFHTMRHIELILGHLHATIGLTQCNVLATLFHDAIYFPGSSQNERLSARLANIVLRECGVADPVVARTCQMIEATVAHECRADDVELAHLLDADLAILGAPATTYRDYREWVRAEHHAFPDSLYHAGRLNFLRATLARSRIFLTPLFQAAYEVQARENLAGEVRSLNELCQTPEPPPPLDSAFLQGYMAKGESDCPYISGQRVFVRWRAGFLRRALRAGDIPRDCSPVLAGAIAFHLGYSLAECEARFGSGIAFAVGWTAEMSKLSESERAVMMALLGTSPGP